MGKDLQVYHNYNILAVLADMSWIVWCTACECISGFLTSQIHLGIEDNRILDKMVFWSDLAKLLCSMNSLCMSPTH